MKIKFLMIFLFSTYSSSAQLKTIKPFYLTGEISGQKNGIVSLSYLNPEGKRVIDSCLIKNGNFYFEGEISEPTIASLRGPVKSIADSDPNCASFFLEPENIAVLVEKDHFKDIKVSGSKTQKDFENLHSKYNNIQKESDSLFEIFGKINRDFIKSHPNSYVSSFHLSLYKGFWPIDSVRMLYQGLSTKIQNSQYGKEVAKRIHEIEANSIGDSAKQIIANDINGNPINLSDFRGKYVLLDFWASWCVPCRKESPHLIELFKKYHGQGLEVIGIADDSNNPDAWKNAIEKDGVNIWYNVLNGLETVTNGRFDRSDLISTKYGVHIFPTKILIDKEGILIGRYKGAESQQELDKKLNEIFD